MNCFNAFYRKEEKKEGGGYLLLDANSFTDAKATRETAMTIKVGDFSGKPS